VCTENICRYLVNVDDTIAKDSAPHREFQQRFLRGQTQLDPILDALADVLLHLWDHYQPVCASSITSSVFQFINYSCVELELERLPLTQNSQRFPWFMRERIGIAEAYGFMTFANSCKVDIMQYIRAAPDMVFWIDAVNDLLSSVFFTIYDQILLANTSSFILSFYKEELAGEKTNYIHTRALAEAKTPSLVLTEIANELRTSRNSIIEALSNNSDALKAWKTWERGYVLSIFKIVHKSLLQA
jgi:hypothetical protein